MHIFLRKLFVNFGASSNKISPLSQVRSNVPSHRTSISNFFLYIVQLISLSMINFSDSKGTCSRRFSIKILDTVTNTSQMERCLLPSRRKFTVRHCRISFVQFLITVIRVLEALRRLGPSWTKFFFH